MGDTVYKTYFLIAWYENNSCGYLVNNNRGIKITLTKLFGNAYVSTNDYNLWFNSTPGEIAPCDYIMF